LERNINILMAERSSHPNLRYKITNLLSKYTLYSKNVHYHKFLTIQFFFFFNDQSTRISWLRNRQRSLFLFLLVVFIVCNVSARCARKYYSCWKPLLKITKWSFKNFVSLFIFFNWHWKKWTCPCKCDHLHYNTIQI